MVTVDRLRIGTLGAARITSSVLIKPARQTPEVTVAAVAARDPERARRFAAKHRIRQVHDSYQALIDDPAIDAIYNPLPNSLHAKWTLRAIEAGKHVLCEKPFTANADRGRRGRRGRRGVRAGRHGGLSLPLPPARPPDAGRGRRRRSGRSATWKPSLCFPLPRFSDIRYSYDLAGGATMDAGCYAINWLRMLGPGEPEVLSARARLHGPDVDRAMAASFRFPGGVLGRMTASLWSGQVLRLDAKAVGDQGVMRVFNYVSPQVYNRLTVTADGYTRRERVSGESTYTHQLRAFAAAVRHGDPVLTTPEDAVANMAVIDAVYRAAGLSPRGA